jgi:uncharacterized membrane protein YcjF (UPF0283 family)
MTITLTVVVVVEVVEVVALRSVLQPESAAAEVEEVAGLGAGALLELAVVVAEVHSSIAGVQVLEVQQEEEQEEEAVVGRPCQLLRWRWRSHGTALVPVAPRWPKQWW